MQFVVVATLVAQLFGGVPIDGISCESMEGAVEHTHMHLQLFQAGRPVEVPANIGISEARGCLYWVHTHTSDGIIHIESPVKRAFTLGEFFDIWGQDLNTTHAADVASPKGKKLLVTVNGKVWHGDPRAIVLRDREEIVIQSGPPYGKPHDYNWKKFYEQQ